MKNCIFTLLVTLLCFGADAQIKTLFKDQKDVNRTIVIKENGADDYEILDDKFGDAKVGEVIRITTNKAPEQKISSPKVKAPKTTKPKPAASKTPPKAKAPKKKTVKKVPEKKPAPKVEKPKIQKKKGPEGPSGIPGTYPVKDHPKGKKVRIKKSKKFKKLKKSSCFDKW